MSVLSACRKSLFAPLPVQFSELGKFRKLLDWTRKGLFAPFTLSPLLCCGAAFHSFLTVSKDGHVVSVLSACRKSLFAPLPVQFSELGKFRKLLDWTRKGLFAPFTLSPLLCCGAAFHSFLTVSTITPYDRSTESVSSCVPVVCAKRASRSALVSFCLSSPEISSTMRP